MAKASIVYVCQECGYQTAKWLGKCPSCKEWQTFVEERKESSSAKSSTGEKRRWVEPGETSGPTPITTVTGGDEQRSSTGISELDRTLGGGIVAGSLTLVGGDPGIGKSTLLLQVAGHMATHGTLLYISGEESPSQIRMRGERLGALHKNLLLLPETDVERIEAAIIKAKPLLAIVDSIQTIFTPDLPAAPGSVGQVRESTARLLALAKRSGIPILLIGHVTKEGAIAGPRVLEHMVDTVLYFEGDKGHPFRILRGVKNRFGSTNEIGVFEMREAGLCEVENPSELFLSERLGEISGSVVVGCVQGARPLLVEIQALVATSNLPAPRRTTVGVDQNRVAILMAIIEKRAGYHLMGEDVFVNIAGGVRVDEPGVDLGLVAAIVSSFRNIPIDPSTIVVGEVGLGGEVRGVTQMEHRINEAAKLGFKRAIIPKTKQPVPTSNGFQIEQVRTVEEALDLLLEG